MANVLVVAETRGGRLRKVALEAVTAARALANAAGGEVHALAFGPPGIGAELGLLAEHGADRALVCEHGAYVNYDPESQAATVALHVAGGGYRAV
ncbi:MAG TPA: electron transfer flavoprotein subunit alpha/FixB family protein, partial [Terriglobia bacterium]|nr:electron transfer flavoprotein subunit alpha/FixB family protein [Terriglobia bacterium]